MKSSAGSGISTLSLVVALSARAAAQVPAGPGDWPQWRGPQRDGVSTETGLLQEWPAGGPPLLWSAKGAGKGYSVVSVAAGRLFTQGDRWDNSYVVAYDAATGNELWEQKNGPISPNSRGPGPRGAVTVEGELIYLLGANGLLACLEAATGKARFSVDIIRGLKGRRPHWGLSESPLIEKDLLIVTPGGELATVAALDKKTGKTVWTMTQGDRVAYSSPVAFTAAGVRQIAVFTAKGLLGMAAEDGRFLWRYDAAANSTANVATPIVRGDQVFISSDYGAGGALLKLSAEGGGVKASQIYFTKEMQNHHSTCVLVGDHLYGFSGNRPAFFACMELQTGKVVYPPAEERRKPVLEKGGLIYADGHLYCLGEEGEMALVEANPRKLVVKSRFKPFEPKMDLEVHGKRLNTWSHPVVAGGRLYLRNQNEIFCYDIKAKSTGAARPGAPRSDRP